ncbi:MAG: formylglycine-generating enzyme family protein, partial [Planctomycetes bacterium]|nr:formylglycine-generating enzyme family protein [Planctomycetota bacterium]
YHVEAICDAAFPVVAVELAPFFLGKFEVTRSQWGAIGGEIADREDWDGAGGIGFGPDHPVGDVSWWHADLALRRFGLVLPTAAQWEHGARAGTTTPWWVGDEPAAMERFANFADHSMRSAPEAVLGVMHASDFDDGYPGMAPVGRFPANPFGLHDVFGNVAEWCGDMCASTLLPARTGDGARFGPRLPSRARVAMAIRGGGFEDRARMCTAAKQHRDVPSHCRPSVGLRAARPLELPWSGLSGR